LDDKTFDALIREAGTRRNRRAAVKGLVGGLFGLGLAREATGAQGRAVGAEGCRIQRCKKAVLGQPCTDSRGNPANRACCQGLKCSNTRGVCVFKNGHGGGGDFCRTGNDCDQRYFSKKNQCIPDSCQF